jgi:hypothetical protein
MREILNGRLHASARAPFEVSYGQSFAHVEALTGPEVDCRLTAEGALALAVDERTILFSARLRELPESARLAVVGHELAHTVQFARGGRDSSGALEEEAWRASWAALRGERCEVRCGAQQETALPAVALVMDKSGSEYFKVFDTLDLLLVTKIETIKPLTYEKLLDLLLDKKFEKESDFVIQVHGTSNGFHFPIVTGQAKEKHAYAHTLRQLMQLDALITAANAAGNDLNLLNAVLKNVMKTDPAADADSAKAKIKREVDRQKSAVGITSDADIARVVKKMAEVRAKKRGKIELRTCNMGINSITLDFFCAEFNADSLGAPDKFSAFGTCMPAIGPNAMKDFIKNNAEAKLYKAVGDQFGFTFDQISDNFTVNTFSAAASEGVVKSFVTAAIMGGKKFQANNFPIHFLLQHPAIFPLDPAYKSSIKRATRKP